MADGLSFLLIIGLSILGAWSVARTERCTAARLTVLGVVSFALCVLAAQLLGTLAALTKRPLLGPWTLALAIGGLGCVVWVVVRTLGARRTGQVAGPADQSALPGNGAEGQSSGEASARGGGPPRRALALVGGITLASLANGVVLGLSGPPRGWDVLTYHLPRAVAWLQHGNLGHYGGNPAFYPGNGEIAMLVTLFTGSDRLTTIVQLPFALLGAVALYGLAREIGAGIRSALLAPLAFVLTPMVVFQTGIAKNDLMIAGVTLAGAYLLVRALGPGVSGGERRLGLVTGGLAFGLVLGTKYTVLPFVVASAAAVMLVLATAWRSGGQSRPDRRLLRVLPGGDAWASALRGTGIFVAALLLPSIFWFAQNWITTGNPFAPVLVKLGGWTVFQGSDIAVKFGEQQFAYVTRPLEWWLFPWIDRVVIMGQEEIVGSYGSSVGFGAIFAAFAIPAVAVLARRAVTKRVQKADPRPLVLLALIVLGVATWWLGGFHLPRYLWPMLALFCAPIALLFDEVRRHGRAVLVGMFVVAAVFSSLETLRIIYATDDFMSSRLPWGTAKRDYYHMPDLIYELPPGTKILLAQVPGKAYHRTFRYPLIGNLPGNEVIMADDVGVELAEALRDTASMHEALRREGVEYIFSRTLLANPRPSRFDAFPNRYEKVVSTIEGPYPWHRTGVAQLIGDGLAIGTPVVTQIHRVLYK